jgi:hypothetical protein
LNPILVRLLVFWVRDVLRPRHRDGFAEEPCYRRRERYDVRHPVFCPVAGEIPVGRATLQSEFVDVSLPDLAETLSGEEQQFEDDLCARHHLARLYGVPESDDLLVVENSVAGYRSSVFARPSPSAAPDSIGQVENEAVLVPQLR